MWIMLVDLMSMIYCWSVFDPVWVLKAWFKVGFVTLWHIWLQRNVALFNGSADNIDSVVHRIHFHSFGFFKMENILGSDMGFVEWSKNHASCIRHSFVRVIG